MSRSLRILMLEDVPADAELVQRELSKAGIDFVSRRVDSRKAFAAELKRFDPDLILSDYSLPSFNGLDALSMTREALPAVPFIFVSGHIGEDRAIDSLLHGATDYVLKEKLLRLVPAVRRAMRESAERADRIRMEAELRENEEKFRLILDSTGEALYGVDNEGRCTFCNPACIRALGFQSADDLIGRNMHELFHHTRPDGSPYPSSECPVHDGRRRGEGAHVDDEVFWRADGTSFPVEYWSRPIRKEGVTVGAVVTFQDITERKILGERIREQASLLNVATDAIIVRNLDDEIIFWNKSAERIYGWTAEEAVGQRVTSLFYHSASDFDRAKDILLKTNEWNGELRHCVKDGGEITVDSRWTLMRDTDGNPKSVLIVNTDITEKKQFQAQVLRSQRLESVGTLAGGIAHDLNNVLAPILLSIDMLRKRFPDSDSQVLLTGLQTGAVRGANMVKQVLMFARGIDGERTTLQLKHLVNEMDKIIRETFPKSIQLRTKTPNNLWPISGDATQLHQVLLNLCLNGRDAMATGGVLTVSADNVTIDENYAGLHREARPGDYVVISVADTGVGIPPGIINNIFDPFFTTKPFGKGTGLGLSTVQSIVKGHGGFINVYSEPEHGTQFRVYLPATKADPKLARERDPGNLPLGHGELVFVVDDEAAVCDISRATLELYGYKVKTAFNGTEAIAVFREFKRDIDLVVTDMMMPFMDGPATIRTMRALNPEVKIVASSGLPERNAEEQKLEVNAFLPKPYTAEALLVTVADVLKKNSRKK